MRTARIISLALIFLWLIPSASDLAGQPVPGDLFREYGWFNDVDDCDRSLRVGGKLDYRLTGNALPYEGNGWIRPDFQVQLEGAMRAELVVEKMLCHGGTKGLPPSGLPWTAI